MSEKMKKNLKYGLMTLAVLILVAAIGGSIGAIAGMNLFRHKTKHAKFYIGLPVILVLQIVAAICIIFYFA